MLDDRRVIVCIQYDGQQDVRLQKKFVPRLTLMIESRTMTKVYFGN
jgi:hypothetical protein